MSDFARITGPTSLTLVRHLPGPIERVWAYLTDPQFLVTWFSDGSVSHSVGGEVRFDMGASGRVTAFQPPHLFEYTWNELELSRGPIADSLVRWELAEEGNGVRLTLTHSRLPKTEVLSHSAGWHAFLHRLSACVDGRTPEPIDELYARFKAEYDKRQPSIAAVTAPAKPTVIIGNHASVLVPSQARNDVRRFYRDVLGGTITGEEKEKDVFRIGEDFYLVFLYGDCADESEFLRSGRSIWLEIKSDNVEEMTRRILESGVAKKLDMPDPHLYFQAPGGQCLRLVGIDEDLSKYEGSVGGPNIAKVKEAINRL
jgi:uncharacterized protein YndB with AHSA1/START domain